MNDVIGKFISLEGVDGAGKTTHLEFLSDYLVKRHVTVLITREPGGTNTGEQLRSILLDATEPIEPLTELLMMFAARAEHVLHRGQGHYGLYLQGPGCCVIASRMRPTHTRVGAEASIHGILKCLRA